MTDILSSYYILKDNSNEFPYSETVCIQIENNLGKIEYTFPQTKDECLLMDAYWYCPTLFSIFQIDDFFKLLSAVLLERSLIFVSDNLTILSSVILGLKTLIKPFQWCYALIPILPSPLVDILDTPQPLLAGITNHDYDSVINNMTEEEMQYKTWVFLDCDNIIIEWGSGESDLSQKSRNKGVMKWSSTLISET